MEARRAVITCATSTLPLRPAIATWSSASRRRKSRTSMSGWSMSFSRCCTSSSGWSVPAARATAQDSSRTRVSTTCATGMARVATCSRRAASSGAEGSAIRTAPDSWPDPTDRRTTPIAASTCSASRTEPRETASCSASPRSPGSRMPTRRSPLCSCCSTWRSTVSVARTPEAYRPDRGPGGTRLVWSDHTGGPMRIALFTTCLADAMFPRAARATVTLLERLGHEVVVPGGQTCCGQMHLNTGYWTVGAPVVSHHVDVFEAALERCDMVVAPSGSCVGSVRHQHAMLARHVGDEGLATRAEQVAGRTFELSELLVDVLGVTDVGAYFPHRVPYPPTCHSLRMLRVGDKPLRLLEAVEGIDLVELPDAESCCGFGGTF